MNRILYGYQFFFQKYDPEAFFSIFLDLIQSNLSDCTIIIIISASIFLAIYKWQHVRENPVVNLFLIIQFLQKFWIAIDY